MIHEHIDTLNEALLSVLPTKCGNQVWTSEMNTLGKLVWSTEDPNRYMHDQDKSFIVREDRIDLQTCHLIDRVRKTKADISNVPIYTIECSWIGVSTKLTAGLLAMSIFEELESLNIYASDFDNNTERILASYWGIDRDKFGHNPEYNAWRISYNYTLPALDRDDLLILEGLTDLD